jgi:nucleoside-diphosphate-sugar epimerase
MFLRSLKVPVLLTGGAGVIGSHIADSLLVRGYEVAVVSAAARQGNCSYPVGGVPSSR